LTITDGYDTESRSYNPCREVKPASSVQTKRERPAELFTRNWERLSASALESIVSMTSYWNAYKLDIPMQSPMAMMSSEQKPPSRQPCQDKAHTMIADFTKIAVSNSDNDLHLVPKYECEIG
jgi:hypothetical protein